MTTLPWTSNTLFCTHQLRKQSQVKCQHSTHYIKTMCGDIGTTSRICAFYSFTGILFTVSRGFRSGVSGRCMLSYNFGTVSPELIIETTSHINDENSRGFCAQLPLMSLDTLFFIHHKAGYCFRNTMYSAASSTFDSRQPIKEHDLLFSWYFVHCYFTYDMLHVGNIVCRVVLFILRGNLLFCKPGPKESQYISSFNWLISYALFYRPS